MGVTSLLESRGPDLGWVISDAQSDGQPCENGTKAPSGERHPDFTVPAVEAVGFQAGGRFLFLRISTRISLCPNAKCQAPESVPVL